jgi:hypothetical protein
VFGAIASVLLGIVPAFVAIPVVVPVIGLALGLSAVIRARRSDDARTRQLWLGTVGAGLGALWIVLILMSISD